ncbi:hypothetical protein GCM10023322_43390 [Rugosimonospora acidiphila]|uniref:Uncharacterized protein n=1 Tax=Rugosimonospora acidiphila TaxID=556531 RepID=A0ABP9S1P2_9ACTN
MSQPDQAGPFDRLATGADARVFRTWVLGSAVEPPAGHLDARGRQAEVVVQDLKDHVSPACCEFGCLAYSCLALAPVSSGGNACGRTAPVAGAPITQV